MMNPQNLRRVLLAGALSLAAGLATAGVYVPPSSSSSNDDTDIAVMIALGLALGSSVICDSDAPSLPAMCSVIAARTSVRPARGFPS